MVVRTTFEQLEGPKLAPTPSSMTAASQAIGAAVTVKSGSVVKANVVLGGLVKSSEQSFCNMRYFAVLG